MSTYLVDKKNVKQFRGHMTTVVQFIHDNFKNSIRFRSTHGDTGNISRISIKGKKTAIYATVDTADEYKKLTDANPRATLAELLDLAKQTNKTELIEVAQYLLDEQYKEMIPIIELDTDIKKQWKASQFI